MDYTLGDRLALKILGYTEQEIKKLEALEKETN